MNITYAQVAYIEVPNRNLFNLLQNRLNVFSDGDYSCAYNPDFLEEDIKDIEEDFDEEKDTEILNFLREVYNEVGNVGDIIFNRP